MKNRDWGAWIVPAALVVGIPRYIAALIPAEPDIYGLSISFFTGTGLAIILEGGTFYVVDMLLSSWRRGRKRWWLLAIPALLQLVLSPVIVAPAIVAHLRGTGLFDVLANWSWGPIEFWVAIVAAVPVLLVAGATLARSMRVQPAKKPATSQLQEGVSQHEPATIETEPGGNGSQPAGSGTQPALASYVCETCQLEFSSQPALNAHQRAHKNEPASVAD